MKLLERILVNMAPVVGGCWVALRRRDYRRTSRSLSSSELAALAPFFDAALLANVLVCIVERIRPPWIAGLAARVGLGPATDLTTVRAMAFDDTIVVSGDEPSLSLLFHELVHVVQYEQFGVGPMLRRYVGDYFESGRDYLHITAERCAYALQARFDANPTTPFSVAAEVRAWFEAPAG